VTQFVPLDAPETGPLLGGPKHLVELTRLELLPLFGAEDQVDAVSLA
jgi:hypothetical protein